MTYPESKNYFGFILSSEQYDTIDKLECEELS